jgi:DNA adenine methylase
MSDSRRALLKWHGSKFRLAKPWIIPNIPSHDLFCEPFGGSGSVTLLKERSRLEVWNDLNWDLHNFMMMLRTSPEHLIWAIQNTPYSYSEWQYASSAGEYFAMLEARAKKGSPPKINENLSVFEHMNGIERARLFYVRCQMSIMGEGVVGNGFRRQKKYSRGKSGKSSMKPAALSWMETDHILEYAKRFKGVVLENAQASDVMQVYDSPETCFYVDPPYLGHSRRRTAAYAHELVSTADHTELLTLVNSLTSMVLISGYRSDLYDSHLAGWQRLDRQARINGPGEATESLWLNPQASERLERDKKNRQKLSPPRLL